jgi:DNA-binding transcriptional regulator YhcF (GntR family)
MYEEQPAETDIERRRTAAELAEAFMGRIASGMYAIGDVLPSCRQAARELHVDKNTVNKAYAMLKRIGVARSVPGRGMVVERRPAVAPAGQALRHSIEAVVWQAKALGVSEDRLWAMLGAAVWRFYGLTQIKVAFIECNEHDATYMGREVEDALGRPVTIVLLADFVADPLRFAGEFDVLATTFNHLATVIAAAGPAADKVVGLHAVPVLDDVLRVAQVRLGSRIVVICTAEPTISLLTSLVRTYNPSSEIRPCLATDGDDLAQAMAGADLIVDTDTSHAFVMRLAPTVPIITVQFRMDPRSIQTLRERILMATRQRVPAPAQEDPQSTQRN